MLRTSLEVTLRQDSFQITLDHTHPPSNKIKTWTNLNLKEASSQRIIKTISLFLHEQHRARSPSAFPISKVPPRYKSPSGNTFLAMPSHSIKQYFLMTGKERLFYELDRLLFIDPNALPILHQSRDINGQLEEIEDAKWLLGLGVRKEDSLRLCSWQDVEDDGKKVKVTYERLLAGKIPYGHSRVSQHTRQQAWNCSVLQSPR